MASRMEIDGYLYVATVDLRWMIPAGKKATEEAVLQQLWIPVEYPRDASVPRPQPIWKDITVTHESN